MQNSNLKYSVETFYSDKSFRLARKEIDLSQKKIKENKRLNSNILIDVNHLISKIKSKNRIIQINFYYLNARFFFHLIKLVKESDLFRNSLIKIFINNLLDFICNLNETHLNKFKVKNSTLLARFNLEFILNYLNFVYENLNRNLKFEFFQFVALKITGINLIYFDNIERYWNSIVLSWLNKKIKYEGYWAYFSTLGGAYSSLGEDCEEHAKNAANISLKQIVLANSFGDPNAICRCKLFLSFSLIQLGEYKQANLILRNELKLLNSEKNDITDDRLKVMCIAGIKKLKFTKSINNNGKFFYFFFK